MALLKEDSYKNYFIKMKQGIPFNHEPHVCWFTDHKSLWYSTAGDLRNEEMGKSPRIQGVSRKYARVGTFFQDIT